MNKNGTLYKALNMFWIILVIIPFLNGLGFIYAGWRVKETKWVDEGILYMVPFILLSFTIYNDLVVYAAIILWFVGIIRAVLISKTFLNKLNSSFQNNQQDSSNQFINKDSNCMNIQTDDDSNNLESFTSNSDAADQTGLNNYEKEHDEKVGRKLDL